MVEDIVKRVATILICAPRLRRRGPVKRGPLMRPHWRAPMRQDDGSEDTPRGRAG